MAKIGKGKLTGMKANFVLLRALFCIYCSALVGAPLDTNIVARATNLLRAADLQTLRSADSIRAFRIEPFYRHPSVSESFKDLPRFGTYPILKESSRTNTALARAVADALLAEERFSPGGTLKCGFAPGVAYRMGNGTNILEILVCFQCDEIKMRPTSGHEDYYLRFETSRARLLALAEQAFPGDPIFEPAKPPENPFE